MVNKDPVSLMKDVIDGIVNNIEQAKIVVQQKGEEIKGFEMMLNEYKQALEAFTMFDIKKRMSYPGLDRVQNNDGTNKETSPNG